MVVLSVTVPSFCTPMQRQLFQRSPLLPERYVTKLRAERDLISLDFFSCSLDGAVHFYKATEDNEHKQEKRRQLKVPLGDVA